MPGDLRRPPRGTTCGRTCAPAGVRTPPRPFAANRDSLRRVAGYVCNYFGQPGGSNLGACADSYAEGFEGAPDGSDFPGNTPGGHSRHCSNMAYDIDGDGLAEIIRCDNAQYVKYLPGTEYRGYGKYANYGSWKTAHIESLGTHFADAFGQGCQNKDCTHGNLYDCVTGVGTGCKDIFGGVAIQCYCSKDPHNCPPFPPAAPAPESSCGGAWYRA